MNLIKSLGRGLSPSKLVLFCIFAVATAVVAQTNAPVPVLQIQAGQVTTKVSPVLYGLMTEEINYSYEGGIYGELIRNRSFKADAIQQPISATNYNPSKYYPVKIAVANAPKFWSVINGSIALDTNQPLNSALNISLRLDTSKATKSAPVGIANDGYWGIPVKPNTTYHVSFFAKGEHFAGSLLISLVHVLNTNNSTITVHPVASDESKKTAKFNWKLGEATIPVANAAIPKISGEWQKYEVTLTTGDIEPSKENRLVISTTKPGTFFNHHGMIWFQQVSLFPPTYNNRANGNRPDIMQLLADMQPKFLRLPGGNYRRG